MNLREAAQQALEALERLDEQELATGDIAWLGKEIGDLRVALADTQDWDEIEALRASLREHMAEIHRLRAAGRQALDALEAALSDDKPYIERCKQSSNALRATLSWDAMQRLTDVQQEIESVTNCHEKEGGKLSPPLNDPETNFGNMGQAVDSTRADNIADANKMVPTIKEMETFEPVAYVQGYRDGWCVISPVEHVVFPTGMALYRSPPNQSEDALGMVEPVAWAVVGDGKFGNYELGNHFEREVQPNFKYCENRGYELIPLYTAPPKREPLTEEQILDLLPTKQNYWSESDTGLWIARAIERAHGIGGEE